MYLSVYVVAFSVQCNNMSTGDSDICSSDSESTSHSSSSENEEPSTSTTGHAHIERKRKYLAGKSNKPYRLRKDLESSFDGQNPAPSAVGPCNQCSPILEKYAATFKGLKHQGNDLKRRKLLNPHPKKVNFTHYRDLKAQNDWLLNNIFDVHGNYLFCSQCVHLSLGVSYKRLARQRNVKRRHATEPIRQLTKAQVENERLGEFVVIPPENQSSFKRWWKQVGSEEMVQVRYPHQKHGLSGKSSNHAKSEVKQDFLEFVDNSQPNGRPEDSSVTHYFLPKFTTIQPPKKDVKNYEQRLKTSLLHEFNRSQESRGRGTCSNYSASVWLKTHRPKHRMYPHRQDYCDTCAQKNEAIRAKQTTLNRLRQTGSAVEQEQKEVEEQISTLCAELDTHKQTALKSHDYHLTTTKRCATEWTELKRLEGLGNNASPEETKKLATLKHSFTLTLSADFQMSKLVPYWGYSDQPGSTYYLQKVSNDIFGIVDHRENASAIYVFDETVGPKNTDHTVSYLTHYLKSERVPDFVKRLHLYLDNTCSTNKNYYFMAWGMELVQSGILDYLRVSFLIAGHTKFAPDRLFSQIANTYNRSDVFSTAELSEVISNYGLSTIDTGEIVRPWRDVLATKHKKIPGIRSLHDFVIICDSAQPGRVPVLRVREFCYQGTMSVKVRGTVGSELALPEDTYKSLNRISTLSETKKGHLKQMCEKFIPRERWMHFVITVCVGQLLYFQYVHVLLKLSLMR